MDIEIVKRAEVVVNWPIIFFLFFLAKQSQQKKADILSERITPMSSKKMKGGVVLSLNNEEEKSPTDFRLARGNMVPDGLREENQSETLRIIRAAIARLTAKKKLTPTDYYKVGMVLGECPKGTTECIPELGQCGSAADLKDAAKFPGGYKVWTTNEKYPVGLCTTDPQPTRAVPVAGIVEEQTELQAEMERHAHLMKLLRDEESKITRLLLFMDHILDCETFQEEESCTQPKMASLGVLGAAGEAPRCIWKADTDSKGKKTTSGKCGTSMAYEREIGALAERKLVVLNKELRKVEASLLDIEKEFGFTSTMRRPVALLGDSHSKRRVQKYDEWLDAP